MHSSCVDTGGHSCNPSPSSDMLLLDSHPSGRHFLQIPGPTNVPDRVLRAIDQPTIDHRGPEFAALTKAVLAGMKRVFKTDADVVIYPASGTGAWEAALVNALSPGDRVLMAETGHFAALWKRLAERLGLSVTLLPGDWRHGVSAGDIEAALRTDAQHSIKAVCVVHNETSTGVPRCSWSIRSRRWRRSTTAMTSGASTSRSAARRRD